MKINCKDTASLIKYKIRDEIMREKIIPTVAIVRFGCEPSSISYSNGIERDCNFTGIDCSTFEYPGDISEEVAISKIQEIACSPVNGIIIQTPLPEHLNLNTLLDFVPSEKDIDGLKKNSEFSPCTAEAVMEFLKYEEMDEKTCLIVSRSNTVGRPLMNMLLDRNATVIVCHSYTPKHVLNNAAKMADVIISATGDKTDIDPKNINVMALLIDVGVREQYRKIVGDFYELGLPEANYTPVPGGIGLITRGKLLEHILQAYYKQKNKEDFEI